MLTHVPLGPEGEPGNPLQEYAKALIPQVEAAVAAGLIDTHRIGLLGHAYGGYGTAVVFTQTDRFAAGMAISGVYDLAASYAESSLSYWYEHGQERMGDHPWARRQGYLHKPPFYQADKIHTPLLLIHGDRDQSIADVRRFFRALERLGKNAHLAVYPGQGHGLGTWQTASARDACQRILDFFAVYLRPESEP